VVVYIYIYIYIYTHTHTHTHTHTYIRICIHTYMHISGIHTLMYFINVKFFIAIINLN